MTESVRLSFTQLYNIYDPSDSAKALNKQSTELYSAMWPYIACLHWTLSVFWPGFLLQKTKLAVNKSFYFIFLEVA